MGSTSLDDAVMVWGQVSSQQFRVKQIFPADSLRSRVYKYYRTTPRLYGLFQLDEQTPPGNRFSKTQKQKRDRIPCSTLPSPRADCFINWVTGYAFHLFPTFFFASHPPARRIVSRSFDDFKAAGKGVVVMLPDLS